MDMQQPLLEEGAAEEAKSRLFDRVPRRFVKWVVLPTLIVGQALLLAVPMTGLLDLTQLVVDYSVGGIVTGRQVQASQTLMQNVRTFWQIGAKPLSAVMLVAGCIQPVVRLVIFGWAYFGKVTDAARRGMMTRQELLGKLTLSSLFINLLSVDALGLKLSVPGDDAAARIDAAVGPVLLRGTMCGVFGNLASIWTIFFLRVEVDALADDPATASKSRASANARTPRTPRPLPRARRSLVSAVSLALYVACAAVAVACPLALVRYEGRLAQFLVDQPSVGLAGEGTSRISVLNVYTNVVTKVAKYNGDFVAWYLAAVVLLFMGLAAPTCAFASAHRAFLETDARRAAARRTEAHKALAWSTVEPLTVAALVFIPAIPAISKSKFDVGSLEACGPVPGDACLVIHADYGPAFYALLLLWVLVASTAILLPRLGGRPDEPPAASP